MEESLYSCWGKSYKLHRHTAPDILEPVKRTSGDIHEIPCFGAVRRIP